MRIILTLVFLAASYSGASAQLESMFQGPWNVNAQRGTISGYKKASSGTGCLTPATRAVLAGLQSRVKVSIVSTCRPGAMIAGTNRPSFHGKGMAVDFNTPNKAAAIAYLRSRGVFVMTYCGMSHVHFNLGQSGTSFCGQGYARGGKAYAKKRYAKKKRWRRR